MMIRILVELGSDRERCGTLNVFDANGRKLAGPFPVAGRASDALAAAKGNPRRDPTLRYGDTPTGSFVVRGVLKTGKTTPFAAAEYGPHGVIVIEGITGEAAIAEANGRFQFLIQAGAPAKDGSLRSTAGALRLSNEHQRVLVAVLRRSAVSECEIVQSETVRRGAKVSVDVTHPAEDPPVLPEILSSRGKIPFTHLSRRDTLRTGGAATVMGLTVSFVGLEVPTARAQTAYSGPNTKKNEALDQLKGLAEHGATSQTQKGIDTAGQKATGSPPDNVPAPTPAQQKALDTDATYQQDLATQKAAEKVESDSVAKQQQIQQQINQTTDPAQRGQLQVDLVKARQDESNAKSAAAAARINADTQKKKVMQEGAPILNPKKP